MGEGTRIYLKAILAQILLQIAWNQTRSGGTSVKPWPWAEMHPVARLQVPAYDENIIVLAGTTGKSLAFGPGHVVSSAAPGTDDNVAIAAHRDTHFAFLEHITPGEVVFLETPDGVRHRGLGVPGADAAELGGQRVGPRPSRSRESELDEARVRFVSASPKSDMEVIPWQYRPGSSSRHGRKPTSERGTRAIARPGARAIKISLLGSTRCGTAYGPQSALEPAST